MVGGRAPPSWTGQIMIEIPEAVTLSRQLTARFRGKKIERIVAGFSPHKFAWYFGDRESYTEITVGNAFLSAKAVGGNPAAKIPFPDLIALMVQRNQESVLWTGERDVDVVGVRRVGRHAA